jgi:hypothetical protein
VTQRRSFTATKYVEEGYECFQWRLQAICEGTGKKAPVNKDYRQDFGALAACVDPDCMVRRGVCACCQ